MEKEYKINGMKCVHCRANVENGLKSLPGVEAVTVSLEEGKAVVKGDISEAEVIAKIEDLGYEYVK